ncbi:hypothetical protein MANES_02G042533v8 [Manihot esculenta]|uniref:Uncharacterized protein n=1 Tax=Manihot esculenta TaxID=3983 RepID=A0ACB7I6K0_MANES|nr:hypothetical protein MANES_02G042533v8 [Manihot esculenta]
MNTCGAPQCLSNCLILLKTTNKLVRGCLRNFENEINVRPLFLITQNLKYTFNPTYIETFNN